MSNYSDSDYAIWPKNGGGRNFKHEEGVQDGRLWRETNGLVETRWGFVVAHSWYFQNAYATSSVEMIKEGRTFTRHFGKEYTARGLVTKAKKFAAELNA